ncbi:MAG: RHS repeat-associated core domain-containing protein, partial [Gammaproteobacteria bacterium]|nr:RHS repeat-associated core domain-containing protein [Gammaproteobacteria bacterium]
MLRSPGAAVLVCALAIACAAMGVRAQTPDDTAVAALEQRIVDGLAAGRDVSALLARLAALGERSRATPHRSDPTAADASEALLALRGELAGLRDGEVSATRLGALRAAHERWRAAHLLFLAHLDDIEATLAGRAARMQGRLDAMRDRYRASVDALVTPLGGVLDTLAANDDLAALAGSFGFRTRLRWQLWRMRDALDAEIAQTPLHILRNDTLPFRRPALTRRSPALEPLIVPVYEDAADAGAEVEDLRGTAQAPLSQDILAQAQALGNDYVRIYEFVRNEIRTEWYAGAMKGAAGTLRQRAGNDVDQASLLIALFRASGLPARYVHGVVELPLETIADSLGLAGTGSVTAALDAAGIAYSPVIRGGRVAAVNMETTWVTARVPYTNYRGAVVDISGPTWIPLAPAFESVSITPPTAIANAIGIDLDALADDYLAAVESRTPRELLEAAITDHLRAIDSGTDYADQLGRVDIVPEQLDLLPSTLPLEVVAITGEGADLDARFEQRLRLVARRGDNDAAPVILDHTLPAARAAGARLTLSYAPASVDDQAIANAFGGLDLTPAYLLKLRPQLRLDGALIAAARDALDAGRSYRFEIRLISPAGEERVTQTLTAGAYHAIGVGAQRVATLEQRADPADAEFEGARILDRIAREYNLLWGDAQRELAALTHVAVVRPLPDITIVSNAMRVETVLGQPSRVLWEGVTIDAASHVAHPIARGADAGAPRRWARLAALEGSALEHRIFESQFLVDAVSADKGLQLARESGIEILTIDAGNAASEIPRLAHPQPVKDDIATWAARGMKVTVPLATIRRNAWVGSVWRAEDPGSGAAGYFIAGGLAGGATALDPTAWANQILRDLLANASSPPPNPNPLAAASITKLGPGDQQRGEVGEPLPEQLTVRVRDASGFPVRGASVRFTVIAGGGNVDGASSRVVATDGQGIARTTLTLGQRTDENPIYLEREPGAGVITQAGINWVEAAVETDRGALGADGPFQAIAFPKPASVLVRSNPATTSGIAGLWSDTLILKTLDEFGNPVPDVDVGFAVQAAQSFCDPPPAAPMNARVFEIGECPGAPTLGSCGRESLDQTSGTDGGVVAGVILGNSNGSRYTVRATASGVASRDFPYTTQGGCFDGPEAVMRASSPINAEGLPINVARPGRELPEPVRVQLFYSVPEVEIEPLPSGRFTAHFLPEREWFVAEGDVVFTPSAGAAAGSTVALGGGRYLARITTGPTPGEITVAGTARVLVPNAVVGIDSDTGILIREDVIVTASDPNVLTGFAVEPEVVAVESLGVPDGMRTDAIHVDESGRSRFFADAHYRISPPSYAGLTTEVDFFTGGVFEGLRVGSSLAGAGVVRIPRGTEYDVDDTHELELVLNRGTDFELRSDRFTVPIEQPLIRSYTRSVRVNQDVDAVNQRACTIGTDFQFDLSEEADVSLVFAARNNIDGDQKIIDPSQTVTLIDNERFGPGSHGLAITPSELPPAEYLFVLTAVATGSSNRQAETGGAISEFLFHNNLPVGHTIVKGVDVYDGNLSVASTDLTVPGRGFPLEFRRTYGANSSAVPGPLGVGWNHNLASRVVITPCGERIVVGGAGNGIRFVELPDDDPDDGITRFTPLKGYHGKLVHNRGDDSYDFYPKDGSRHHYRNFGGGAYQLEFMRDTNGNVTRFGYTRLAGDLPQLSVVEDPSGRTLELVYEDRAFNILGASRLASVVSRVDGPGGQVMRFSYDDRGNLIRAAREDDARVELYTYIDDPQASVTSQHKLETYTDPNGHRTTYSYNEAQRSFADVSGGSTVAFPYSQVSTVSEPESGTTTFDYDLGTRTTTVTNGRGAVFVYETNSYGSVVSLTDPAGTSLTTWTDDDVLPLSQTDANGVTTTFTYDAAGNMLTETVAGAHVTTFTYAALGDLIRNRVETRTDRNGHVTRFEYDARGNLLRTIDAEGGETVNVYAANGDRVLTRDPNGNVTRFTYDTYGNVASVTDALGRVTRTRWDVRSRPLDITDALGRVTRNGYDTLNRLTSVTDAIGGVREMAYDPAGNKIREIDEADRETRFEYDGENRLVRVVNAMGDAKTLAYDAAGNKTAESDFRGNVTTFVYDLANRMTERRQPLGRTTHYTHDPVGNPLTETDALDRTTTFEYDELNRVVRRTDAAGGVATTTYDGEGNVRAQTDELGRETTFAYDRLNRLVTRTEPLGRVTRFEYDANGNPTAEIDPLARRRLAAYDALDRVIRRTDALSNTTTFAYDEVGNLVRQIDARLSQTAHAYDRLNRRISTTDPLRFATRFEYDAVGNRIKEIRANGNEVLSAYDNLNRLVEQTDSLGPVARFEYDADGNQTLSADANGNETVTVYDALGQPVEQQLPEDRVMRMAYDAVGNKTSETDPNGNTTRYEYDELNRPVVITDPFDETVTRTYDPVGNTLTETDKRGAVTRFEYDDLDRLIRTTDRLDQVMSSTWDAVGNKLTDTDKRGTLTRYTYDAENRLTSTQKDGVTLATSEYDAVGNVLFTTDANGNRTAFVYDARNQVTTESRPLAAITTHVYDSMGDRLQTRDPEGRISRFTYDARRRTLTETNGAGETATFVYDGNGNRTELRRPEGNTWRYAYDGANRLVTVTDPLDQETRYAYDKNGNRLAQADALGNVTAFEYDALDRRTRVVYPDTGAGSAEATFAYDANGNLVTETDANGRTTTHLNDPLDRRLQSTFETAPGEDELATLLYSYDPNNNLTRVAETYSGATGIRISTRAYDAFDRLVEAVDARGETLRYAYDANGNRTRLTDPDGKVTRYQFDALNRVVGVINAEGVTEYGYDRSSLQTRVRYPNGTETTQRYDLARRVEQIEHRQGAVTLSRYAYAYDDNGNRTEQRESNGGAEELTTYRYDATDRLLEVTYPETVTLYAYDGAYNRSRETTTRRSDSVVTLDQAYVYNARNQLTELRDALAGDALVAAFTYDANGNRIAKSGPSEPPSSYVYDPRDRLTRIETGALVTGEFLYDWQGLRVRKATAGDATRYVYDDQSVLVQTDDAGATKAKYDYGADRLLSLRPAAGPSQFYFFDALGSVVNLATATGTLQARYRYDAWGNSRGTVGDSINPFGFTGHERDDESGLYYFKARFYDPELGLFLTEDPVEGAPDRPPSLHRYLYAFGNPTAFIDPDGRTVQQFEVLLTAAIDKFVNTSNRTALGTAGELQLEKVLEKSGEIIIKGPRRSPGQHNADVISYNPETKQISFFDNKIQTLRENVSRAPNLSTESGRDRSIQDALDRIDELELDRKVQRDIRRALNEVAIDHSKAVWAVSNASPEELAKVENKVKRISQRLVDKGVRFAEVREHSVHVKSAQQSAGHPRGRRTATRALGKAALKSVPVAGVVVT